MSDLLALARTKTDAVVRLRAKALPTEIQAIQSELSAKGLLKSGAMLKRVLRASVEALERTAENVSEHYIWAATHALLATQTWIEQLVVSAQSSFQPLEAVCEDQIRKAAVLSGNPELTERLLADFSEAKARARESVATALRSKFAERRRGLIRGLPSLIPKFLSRFFGGGGA
jgi:hypothetical protein